MQYISKALRGASAVGSAAKDNKRFLASQAVAVAGLVGIVYLIVAVDAKAEYKGPDASGWPDNIPAGHYADYSDYRYKISIKDPPKRGGSENTTVYYADQRPEFNSPGSYFCIDGPVLIERDMQDDAYPDGYCSGRNNSFSKITVESQR